MHCIQVTPDAVNLDFCQQVIQRSQQIMDSIDGGSDEENKLSTRRKDKSVFLNNHDNGLSLQLHQAMQEPLLKYRREYDTIQTCDLSSFDCKVQKTEAGGGYHDWHAEATTRQHMDRVLVWMIYLNDDYTGGKTQFLWHKKEITPKTGTLVLWPAAFTHPHRGDMVVSGTKWVATGWWFHRA